MSEPWHPDRVIEPRFAWRIADPVTASAALADAGAGLGLGTRAIGLLAGRGLTTAADVTAFFADPLDGLHDPRLLPDADAFVERITRARTEREKVMVFGDFDADGLTGLAILVRTLRRLDIDTMPYVPSRLDEGHGLSLLAVEAARDAGATLIVTVDCGSTSLPEIAAAGVAGIDVIVTDHHRLPPELPAAVAIVNPQRADSRYPERRLAGSGVAFKLAQLLLADEPGGPDAALELADLATIGSIADLVPVLGETRAIVRLGLARIAAAPRAGIAALLASANVRPQASDVETLSFAVAPRINAAGRVGESRAAAALLLTDDRAEADALGSRAGGGEPDPARPDDAGDDRGPGAGQPTEDRRRRIRRIGDEGAPALYATIVHGPWPVGIVGLVASRLVEDHGKPAIVGADLGDVIRASCRSNGRLDLGATLDACGDLFIRHGGHAGAAGFEIEAATLAGVRRHVRCRSPPSSVPDDPRLPLAIDLSLPAMDVDYALHRDLRRLAPCGIGNPGAADRRRGPGRDPRPGGQRRPHPAHAQAPPRRPRRDRVRAVRPDGDRP